MSIYHSILVRLGFRPRLIDMCLLFNEIDLLEIRLRELEKVVDKFVIVESDRTFAGHPKPFFFEHWQHRFRQWRRKIVYHKLQLDLSYTDEETERFRNEARHRDEFATVASRLGLAPNDIVVISDVDEIWRAKYAKRIRLVLQHSDLCVMSLHNYRGYINNTSDYALNGLKWLGPVACRAKLLSVKGANKIRRWGRGATRSDNVSSLSEAGWHFSSMGGPEAFWLKSQNFSHTIDPHRVIDVPEVHQDVQVFSGPFPRDVCVAAQRTYLSHASSEFTCSPLVYEDFVIEQDVPHGLRAFKEHYRRFFFFTDCV